MLLSAISLLGAAVGFTPAPLLAPAHAPALASAPLTPTFSALRASLVAPVMYAAFAKMEKTKEGDESSFVATEMRSAAMALHTRDQAPKEGKQPAQRPVQSWQPGRPEYLQFLVDSRHVYLALDEIVGSTPAFESFRNSGLERADALAEDIAWFAEQGVPTPPVATQGTSYAALLRSTVAAGELEKFVCHFYNFYFAHTAGGRMIGKRMADMLLDGKTLQFYQWSAGDVDKELLPGLRSKIDAMAETWSREQKDACLAETANSFRTGGSMLSHLRNPPAAANANAPNAAVRGHGGGARWSKRR